MRALYGEPTHFMPLAIARQRRRKQGKSVAGAVTDEGRDTLFRLSLEIGAQWRVAVGVGIFRIHPDLHHGDAPRCPRLVVAQLDEVRNVSIT
jgi:hypothetical protein